MIKFTEILVLLASIAGLESAKFEPLHEEVFATFENGSNVSIRSFVRGGFMVRYQNPSQEFGDSVVVHSTREAVAIAKLAAKI